MHGTIMVFFVLTTARRRVRELFSADSDWCAGYGVPGAEHAFVLDDVCGVSSASLQHFCDGGAPLHGWTGYAPLSAFANGGPGEQLGAICGSRASRSSALRH